MNARVEKLRALVDGPMLVTNLVNVRYLTGFRSSNAAVLVESDRVRVFADFRYAEQGRALEGAEFVEVSRNLPVGLAQTLSGRILFEADHVTYAAWETLRAGGLELVPTTGLTVGLRAVKEAEELEAIRHAASITDRGYARLAEEPFAGRTERDLAWRMEQLLHEEGADGLAFPVIVAGGPNAANPHTVPGDRPLQEGDTVIVDAGATWGGYCSDCTRTFAVGELSDRLSDAYELVRDAQLAGLQAVAPGIEGKAADAVPRRIVDATEFEGTFGHGLGHGVGMEVHEAPTLRPESTDLLAAGNVVSVEPGIYLPGEGGIRIEDLVVVTEDGCERLSLFPKELLQVG
ncbi:MAG: M24 family metallopeptidase [Pseudomonadota bacterium]